MNEENRTLPKAEITPEQYAKLNNRLPIAKIWEEGKEKREDVCHQSMANERATKEPIPDVVNEAFTGLYQEVDTSVGKVSLRKPTYADIKIFKLTNSPIYNIIMGDIPETDKVPIDQDAMVNLVYQFTHDAKEVYNDVLKDKEVWYERAFEEIGFIYQINDVLKLVECIMHNIGVSALAKKSFESAPDDDKKKLTS